MANLTTSPITEVEMATLTLVAPKATFAAGGRIILPFENELYYRCPQCLPFNITIARVAICIGVIIFLALMHVLIDTTLSSRKKEKLLLKLTRTPKEEWGWVVCQEVQKCHLDVDQKEILLFLHRTQAEEIVRLECGNKVLEEELARRINYDWTDDKE